MKFVSKFVTGLFLLFLGAVSVFAAIPCQEEMRSSVRCDPSCKMTVEMGKSSAPTQIGTPQSSKSCCKVLPGTPVSTYTTPIQRNSGDIALVANTLPSASIMMLRIEQDRTPPDRMPRNTSQSILCTFLI